MGMSAAPEQRHKEIETDQRPSIDDLCAIGTLLAAFARSLREKKFKSLRRPFDQQLLVSILACWAAIIVAFLLRRGERHRAVPIVADDLRRHMVRPPQAFAAP